MLKSYSSEIHDISRHIRVQIEQPKCVFAIGPDLYCIGDSLLDRTGIVAMSKNQKILVGHGRSSAKLLPETAGHVPVS